MSETPAPPAAAEHPLPGNPIVEAVRPGYAFEGRALELGGLMPTRTT